MDLEAVSKALSKRRAFSPKRVAFFVVAGLALVGGILLRTGQYFGQPDVEQSAPVTVAAPPQSPPPTAPAPETTESVAKTPALVPATAPVQQTEPSGDVVEQAKPAGEAVPNAAQSELPAAGMILVSRQPIKVLASPSSSAATTYGFPAGRPFRVIGHEGGFVQIKDLKSGASGWIDEAAVSPPPNVPTLATPARAPAVSAPSRGTAISAPAPSQAKPVAVSRKPATPSATPKPKAAKTGGQVAADSEPATETDPVETQRRPGLIGGLFGGIFGGGNNN
jgi:hypothetical protein